MDLTTMLQKLEDGKYREVSDIKRSFDQMFQNCFKYNSPGSDVYEKGVEFQRAFKRVWVRKDDWIEAQAAKSRRVTNEDIMDDSREHHTSDDDQTESSEESDEDSQEDDEASDEDFYRGQQRIVLDEDFLTDNNTSDDDRTEDSSESENDRSSDETYDDDSPKVKRRRYALHESHPADDDTFKKHERKWRARKKDGLKRHLVIGVNNLDNLLDYTKDIEQTKMSQYPSKFNTTTNHIIPIPLPKLFIRFGTHGQPKQSILSNFTRIHSLLSQPMFSIFSRTRNLKFLDHSQKQRDRKLWHLFFCMLSYFLERLCRRSGF
jgi:hypothetical protein